MEIGPSARKHGVHDDAIRHAVEHAVASEEAGENPRRMVFLGPDLASNLLEVVVIIRTDRSYLAVHAMKMRPKYRRLLP